MLTLKDVCKYLGISRFTIYRLIESGKLAAKRISGQWRFEQRDVDKLLTYKSPAKYIIKPDLMTLKEVCEYLGLSRRTLYRLINPVRDRSPSGDRDSGINSNYKLAKEYISNSSNESKNISNGVKDKRLHGVKSAGRWRFAKDDVRQFLTRGRNVPSHVLGMHFEGGVMSLSQVAKSLGVNRRTVYRLIKEGKLPATKIAGVWRFIRTEVSRYMLDRKYSYGTTGVKGIFFYSRVLDKYYKKKDIYYIKDSAYDGFVGSKQDYHDYQTLRSIHADMPNDKFFAELHYRKVSIKGGFILTLTYGQYENLPKEEYVHWSGFVVPDNQLRHLQL